MASRPPATGENITALHRAAGLTQHPLAGRANISVSMLSKVEIGDRAASYALFAAVARALGVPIERLHGQPYAAEHREAGTQEIRSIPLSPHHPQSFPGTQSS